jgi:hypothetical protein
MSKERSDESKVQPWKQWEAEIRNRAEEEKEGGILLRGDGGSTAQPTHGTVAIDPREVNLSAPKETPKIPKMYVASTPVLEAPAITNGEM